jgi:hypothetical protein
MGENNTEGSRAVNIKVSLIKYGDLYISLTVRLRSNEEIFYKNVHTISQPNTLLEFDCDWPFNTPTILEFETKDNKITDSTIIVDGLCFDDFWDSPDLPFRGKIAPLNRHLGIDTSVTNHNTLFCIGKLEYHIPARPLLNWTMPQ